MSIFRAKPSATVVEGEVLINSGEPASENKLPHRIAMVVAVIAACFLGYNYAKRYALPSMWFGDTPSSQVVAPPGKPSKPQGVSDVQETVIQPRAAALGEAPAGVTSVPTSAAPGPLPSVAAPAPIPEQTRTTPSVISSEKPIVVGGATATSQPSVVAVIPSQTPEAQPTQTNVTKPTPMAGTPAAGPSPAQTPMISTPVAKKSVDTTVPAKRDRNRQPDSWQEGKRFL